MGKKQTLINIDINFPMVIIISVITIGALQYFETRGQNKLIEICLNRQQQVQYDTFHSISGCKQGEKR